MRRTIHFLFCALLCLCLGAQTTPPSELDTKYTPNEASPFNKLKQKKSDADYSEVTISNSIKFCPTMLIRQKAAFFYERRLVDGLSVNVGIGKAFGADAIQNAYWTTYKTEYVLTGLSTSALLLNGEYYSSSLLYMAGMRIYFSGTAFDGGFFEFNYRRESMTYQLKPRINNWRIEGDPLCEFRMTNFNFGFGVTNTGGSKNNITHEFFVLAGFKNFLVTSFDLVDHSGITGQSGDLIYRNTGTTTRARIIPAIHVGYAFGFGF